MKNNILNIISICLLIALLLRNNKTEIIEKKTFYYNNTVITKANEIEPISLETRNVEIPYDNINFSAKPYMDIKHITNQNSPQWQYLTQQECIKTYVDNNGIKRMGVVGNNGFIMIDDYYGVAMGKSFGDIGTKYELTLDSGKILKVIKIEQKAPADTCQYQFMSYANDIIEFVIDGRNQFMKDNIAQNGYIFSGNFNNCELFRGDIIKIEEIIE